MTSGPVTVRLTRATGQQWGFRLHGGWDFNQPLVILKVSGGSIAENLGLAPGDAILAINGQDATVLKHKDAQDTIARSGNTLELTMQKAALSTWKPSVTPVGQLTGVGENRIVTKTSLARNQPSSGSFRSAPGVNSIAKPFFVKDGKTLVNNQFNSPINLYSDANIAETLNAQAEVLAGGAIGVNFKKNEKQYKYEDSEVYKMLKQVENEPDEPYAPEERGPVASEPVPPPQLTQTISSLRPVRAPETKPKPADQPAAPGSSNPNLCAECERLIVGVFVRIKDKNLHVECFRCATCGQSLKNIGYFNINNKLYCDVHAQTIARNNPPAPGLTPFIPSVPTIPQVSSLPAAPAAPLGGSGGISIPIAEAGPSANLASATAPPPPLESLAPVASINTTSNSTSNPVVLPASATSSLLLNTVTNSASAETLITASSASEKTSVVTGDAQNIFVSTTEDTRQTSYSAKPDPYAQTVAPQPFHHSPTAPSHVAAPSNLVRQSSFLEKKTFSETVTKSGPGSKFVWPPAPGNDDPVMLGSPGGSVAAPAPAPLPSQPAGLSQSISSTSSLSQSSIMNQSSLGQSSLLSSGVPSQSSLPTYAPSSLYQTAPQPYKPVVPPKPRIQQTPYKPLSTLLTPASKPAGPIVPTPPIVAAPVQPSYAPAPSVNSLGSTLGNLTLKKGQNVGRGILPNRGRGILTQPGPRLAICGSCQRQIRGPFITAGGGKFYCPDHFKCGTPNCNRPLIDIGFVEERGQLYCEYCWESYLAPVCAKCNKRVKNECLNALGQQFHPTCFTCSHCHVCFGNNPFYLEDGRPFCEKDWNELFTTKCYACGYPIEAGDRWVEALNQNYHSQCFNCSACKKNLEGQSFFAKGGRPFCKSHAR